MDTPDPDWIEELRQCLLKFFRENARPMPWRETSDPYAIWVSEVMLQQTRVDTVIPYYQKWMERFPTVDALAAADEEEVLKRWEGLGYYSRARNLHRAAMLVRERHGGELPSEPESLRELPGVGAYTSGAIASIAFGVGVPAVDGNVRRVVARLLDWPDPKGRALEEAVAAWVPGDEPGDFNQALMELGATVCLPKGARCGECPVDGLCIALREGTVDARPVGKAAAPPPRVREAVAVVVDATSPPLRLALRKRPGEGLLAGMYEFPGSRVPEDAAGAGSHADLVAGAAGGTPLPAVPHAFSHLHVTYLPFLYRRSVPPSPECDWFTPEEVRGLPLPVAQQSIVRSALEALAEEG